MKMKSLKSCGLLLSLGISQLLYGQTRSTPENAFTYLALGDSYTIGESVHDDERYPVQLTEELRSRGMVMLDPMVIATTGWTTLDLKSAIEQAGLERRTFDLVSLLIGVNDQYQGKIFEEYGPNFRVLLESAIALAGGNPQKVFVISIPDYAYTPFGQKKDPQKISRELDEYNRINRSLAEEYNITYFDITPISRRGLDIPELVADDGLHPSGMMYSQWVDLMAEDVLKKLEVKTK